MSRRCLLAKGSGQVSPVKATVRRIPHNAEHRDARLTPERAPPPVGPNDVATAYVEAHSAFDLKGDALAGEASFLGEVEVAVFAEVGLLWCLREDPALF